MMPVNSVTVVLRWTNALLALGFIVNLGVLRFSAGRRSPFFLPWLLFWLSFAATYIVASFASPALTAIVYALDILTSFFLFLASEFLRSGSGRDKSPTLLRPLIKWGVPCTIALVALSATFLQPFGGTASSLLSFLAIAVYARRYGKVVTDSGGWVSVLLYIYAATHLVLLQYAGFGPPFLFFAFTAISVPLKIVLYYSGYVALPRVVTRAALPVLPTRTGRQPRRRPASDRVGPPEPTVTIEFTNFWGFLYILWRYPSGKALVVLILGSLLSAIIFIASNLQALVKTLLQVITP